MSAVPHRHLSALAVATAVLWTCAAATAQPAPPPTPPPKQTPVTVSASLSNSRPTFGDRIELIVKLTYPRNLRVFFPPRPNLKPLLVPAGDPGKVERVEAGDTIKETIRIPALAVRAGLLRTPQIEIPYHRVTASGGAGESGTAIVPSLRAVVGSQFASEVEAKAAPLPPPLPLVEENTPLEVALLILLMMIVAAGLTLIGLRIYRNRARRAEPEPQVPPHIIAFGRIEELARSGRLDDEEPRLIYGDISEILRQYLGGRYKMLALDMTSTELLQRLQEADLAGMSIAEFQAFTDTSDLVKFARQGASPEELGEALAFVRKVVEKTMQTPEEVRRLHEQRIARLARQKRLRVQVMAPLPLRFKAFAVDAIIGTLITFLVAWLAIDTGRRGLFDAAYLQLLMWLTLRDVLGECSPGKVLVGLRIAVFDPNVEVDPEAALHDNDAAFREGAQATIAGFMARLKRNLLMAIPGAGVVAEAITCIYLPEQRRLGDQWAETRVIDGRFGLRAGGTGLTVAVLLALIAIGLLLMPLLALGGRPI